MSFPEWAPVALVREYEKLKDEAQNCRHLANHDDGSGFSEFCPVDWIHEAGKNERLEKILWGLLTQHDMQKVWQALAKPAINPRYETMREYLLWDCIKRALQDYEQLLPHAQTHAEKRKSLLAIVSKINELQAAIAEHPVASRYSKRIVELHLSTEYIERQWERGGVVDQAEWQVPGLALSGDLEEARRATDDGYEGPEKLWANRPLTDRLAAWAYEANETTLDELLNLLSASLTSEAKKEPEIKQPGRGEDALKPFLVRRLSEYMKWFYGQPLSDVVAILATIILGLDCPLTRDDIRPYVRSTGKKTAKIH